MRTSCNVLFLRFMVGIICFISNGFGLDIDLIIINYY